MAFDDETIRIQVDGAQAQAQLNALEKEVRDLEAELKTLNSTAGVTSVEIAGTTRRLGEAQAKLAEAKTSMQGFGQSVQGAGLNMKDLTKSVGAGISIIGILHENIRALGPALEDVGKAIKFAAESAGADAETMTNLGRALDSLIHPSHIAANAVDSLREGWKKLIDTMVESSTVIPHTSQTIEESLKILEEARKKAAQGTEDSSKQEEAALRATQKAEEDLEKAALKSAEERAKAEAKAAEEIVAALEKERIALDAKLAQDQARLSAALAKGSPLDTSKDADEAEGKLADLRQEIQRLENTPLLSADEINKLNTLKDSAVGLTRTVRDLNSSFTIGSDNFLDEAQAATAAVAAWDVYKDMRAQAQNRIDLANDSFDAGAGFMGDYSDAADDASVALGGVADAAADVGDKARVGADAAKDSMKSLTDGAKEALPILKEIRVVLKEIVALGAQADI